MESESAGDLVRKLRIMNYKKIAESVKSKLAIGITIKYACEMSGVKQASFYHAIKYIAMHENKKDRKYIKKVSTNDKYVDENEPRILYDCRMQCKENKQPISEPYERKILNKEIKPVIDEINKRKPIVDEINKRRSSSNKEPIRLNASILKVS